jgi:carbamoyltransferase
VLGVNCFAHDTAACLLVDGEVVAVAEQERFNRDRHTRAFPDDAIAHCLAEGGVTMREVDVVAFGHDPLRDLARGTLDALARAAPKRLVAQGFVDSRLIAREARFRRRYGYLGPLVHVGHHEAHAASAFYPSPFERAAVLTLDRGGDFLSTTTAIGEGTRLCRLGAVANPHSLGEVYSAFTWYLGFTPNGDEGKVMGLAPYGDCRFVEEVDRMVERTASGQFRVDLRFFGYHREGLPVSRRFLRRYGPPRVPESELPPRDRALARAVQHVTEEVALHVARHLRKASGCSRLCLAGGVALNSVMNARLWREAGFEEVFVQPLTYDAGNALGAALFVWHHLYGRPRAFEMRHAHLGKQFGDDACERALADRGVPFHRSRDVAAETAALLAEGRVVGWFQGREEVGPRALGARSILADPRPPTMRDRVNHRVKHREWFRPFAPSVLDEHGSRFFEGYRTSPFMLLVFPVRADKAPLVPSVTHVDGSARLQSVTADALPLFRRLLEEFWQRTGIPMVLNTSFNLRGEPIVHRPSEAVSDFLRTELDALVLGPFIAEKPCSRDGP